MQKSTHLFHLIHSLDAQEKRYFRRYAEQHVRKNGSVYLCLFDAILQQQEPGEEALRKALGGASFVKHLSATKNQLKSLILKALRTYHSGNSIDSQLRTLEENIELLYRRGLYAMCRTEIEKARKLAGKHHSHLLHVSLNHWDEKLLMIERGEGLEERLDVLTQENRSSLQQHEILIQNRSIYQQLRVRSAIQPRARTPEDHEHIDALIRQLPLASQTLGTAHYFRLNAEAHHFFMIGEFESCLGKWGESWQYFQAEPQAQREHPDLLRDTITNYLNCCLITKRYAHFHETLQIAHTLQAETVHATVRLRSILLYQQLVFGLNFSHPEDMQPHLDQLDALLAHHRARLPASQVVNFHHNLAVFHFLHGQVRRATLHVHQLLGMHKGELRRDLRQFARILQLIVDYEAGKLDLGDYHYRSTLRYFKTQAPILPYEQALLTFLRGALAGKPDHEFLVDCEAFKVDLEHHQNAPGRKPIGLQELIFWMESKLQRRTLAERYAEEVVKNRRELMGV